MSDDVLEAMVEGMLRLRFPETTFAWQGKIWVFKPNGQAEMMNELAWEYHVGCSKSMLKERFGQKYHSPIFIRDVGANCPVAGECWSKKT